VVDLARVQSSDPKKTVCTVGACVWDKSHMGLDTDFVSGFCFSEVTR
jgi:hypothetical protein